MANPNWSELLTSTQYLYRNKFVDNVFGRQVLGFNLLGKGDAPKSRVRLEPALGLAIVEDMLMTKTLGGGTYSRYDTLGNVASETGTAAQFEWKQYQIPIVIDRLTMRQNAGALQRQPLVNKKIKQAQDTAAGEFNTMFYGDGTGNSGKNFNGIGNLVGDHLSTVTTVGGIDCTTAPNALWRSKVVRKTGTPLQTEWTVKDWRSVYNSVAYGNDKADLVLTTQTLFEAYEASLAPNVRYEDTKSANAGFETLTFKNAAVAFDDETPAGFTYFLNFNHLHLVGDQDTWFMHTDMDKPDFKDSYYSHILTYGQLTTDSRRHQGLITGATVA
jgi:hypothetical protein